MWKKILNAIFPQFCVGCSQEGALICEDCLSTIAIAEYQFCPFCSKPRRVFGNGKCPVHRNHFLDKLFSATSYEDNLVKKMLISFKYEPFLKTLAKPLSDLIIAHILLSESKNLFQNAQNSIFIAMPLFSRRERWRGYNQSELLAKKLSVYFKIPLLSNNLIKIKKTCSQTELSREQRRKNIKNVFRLKNPEQVRDKTVFLIDDIFTTGATMEETSRVLKLARASSVYGITIAREGLKQ
jgi:ComF family protein